MAWSLVHGIARLAVAGRLPFDSHAASLQFADRTIARSLGMLAWQNP